jgi:atypical dual specificity phosphatase
MARHYFFPTAYSWGHQIDNRLYLGAIPLHEYNHLENFRFRIRGPLAILSLLEPFELERKYVFPSAVAHDEWEDSGVKTLQLPAVDCEPVEQKMIEQGVQFIRDMNAEGRTVYVHCKAGVGRSATVVACKILQDGLANGTKFHSAQDAIQYVRSKRNFVIIHKGHARAAIEQFFQRLCAKP